MMNRIKVAIVVPSLGNLGPEIVMKNVTRNLCDRVDFVYISLRNNNKSILSEYKKNKVYELGMKKIPRVSTKKKIEEILKKEGISVLHVNCFWPVILCKKIRCKKMATVHCNPYIDFSYEYGNIAGRVMAVLFVRALRKYNRNILISEYLKNVLSVGNSEVIYNSVEDVNPRGDFRLPRGFDQGRLNLYTVSLLKKGKNIPKMIEIMGVLKKNNVDARLYIIGDGLERDSIEKMILDKKLEGSIEMLGQQNKNFVKSFSAYCDCFLFTSINEGLGLAVIEALRDGRYVCSSNFETASEIMGDGCDGKICEGMDDFVSFIKKMRDKKKTEHRILESDINRLLFEEKFTDKRMVDKYFDVYAELAKKNVMYYIPFFGVGGIETLIGGFIDKNKDKYNFSILVEHEIEKEILANFRLVGVDVLKIPDFKSIHLFRYIKALNRVFVENDIDIFHSNDYTLRILPLFFAKRHKVAKRIEHIHSSSLEGTKFVRLKKKIINWGVSNANEILYCSNMAKEFSDLSRGTVLYNGVDCSKFDYSNSERLKIRAKHKVLDGEFLILQIGRMVPVKNFNFTLEVIKRLPSNYKLICLGDGPLLSELKNKTKLYGINDRVIFAGNVKNVSSYLSAADLFVLPSLFEGIPITLLEAAASGLPCIISDNITRELSSLKKLEYATLKLDDWVALISKKRITKRSRGYSGYMKSTKFSIENFCHGLEVLYDA